MSYDITKFKKIRISFYKLCTLPHFGSTTQTREKYDDDKNGISPNFQTEGNFTTMKFENESQKSGFHKIWNLKI